MFAALFSTRFVHTEAGPSSLSMGLDVLSESSEQLRLLEAYAMGLPFQGLDHTQQAVRVLACQVGGWVVGWVAAPLSRPSIFLPSSGRSPEASRHKGSSLDSWDHPSK